MTHTFKDAVRGIIMRAIIMEDESDERIARIFMAQDAGVFSAEEAGAMLKMEEDNELASRRSRALY